MPHFSIKFEETEIAFLEEVPILVLNDLMRVGERERLFRNYQK